MSARLARKLGANLLFGGIMFELGTLYGSLGVVFGGVGL
jgi:hypothetical protein